MTDVIDESLTWEQRREMRRKKRQELLAEADRITTTQSSYGDDNSFEQERQRRRRDREEKRRKEREELEKQLKDEDEARAERERRREERRRQREGETVITSYSSKTKDYETDDTKADVEEVTEETADDISVEKENGYINQNGDEEAEVEDENAKEEDDENSERFEPSAEISDRYEDHDEQETEKTEEVEEDLSEEEESPPEQQDESLEEDKSQSEIQEERKRERERRRQEEEEEQRAAEERRKEEYEAKLQKEREERAQRMAEAETRRKELRHQSSKDAKELAVKGNLATPLAEKMKGLSEKMADTPKTNPKVDTSVAKISSLDDRLKNYKSKAERQEQAKKSTTPKSGGKDVANRLSMWESGKVSAGDKTPKKALDTSVVKQSQGVSSRKNLWETGRVASSAEKKTSRPEVQGANLASRKNLWLKVTQETSTKSPSAKSDDTQVIKTGVMSRLNKWEKGEVTGSTTAPKQKSSQLPMSDVSNRRTKWENRSHENPTQTNKKTPVVHSVITTEVSARKHLYESKAESTPAQRKDEDIQPEDANDDDEPSFKRKESVDSRSGESDEQVLSDGEDPPNSKVLTESENSDEE